MQEYETRVFPKPHLHTTRFLLQYSRGEKGAQKVRAPGGLRMKVLHRQVHMAEQLEGVRILSPDGLCSPPWIGIVGALHGNEPCGLTVFERLLDEENPVRRRLTHGTLVLIHGNPVATGEGLRYTSGGVDLNRLFDFGYEASLPRERWTYEHHRALALRSLLDQLDCVLDLHSSTLASPPFVITPPEAISLADRLGCPFVSWGWDGPGIFSGRVLVSVPVRRGKLGVAVECGQHLAPETVENAWHAAERFLYAVGVLSGPAPDLMPHARVEVMYRIGKPTADFSFARPWKGFDRVRRGELLGEGHGYRLTASDDYFVLLPNQNVPIGDDVFYLGVERPHE